MKDGWGNKLRVLSNRLQESLEIQNFPPNIPSIAVTLRCILWIYLLKSDGYFLSSNLSKFFIVWNLFPLFVLYNLHIFKFESKRKEVRDYVSKGITIKVWYVIGSFYNHGSYYVHKQISSYWISGGAREHGKFVVRNLAGGDSD